jgi:hypothetical protein
MPYLSDTGSVGHVAEVARIGMGTKLRLSHRSAEEIASPTATSN